MAQFGYAFQKERDHYWDNVKGFLILSVVAGHLLGRYINVYDTFSWAYDLVNNYHMPLFIFVSGLFAHKAHSSPEKRAGKMLLYYVIIQTVNCAVLHLFDCSTAVRLTYAVPGYTFWYLLFMVFCIMLTHAMDKVPPKIWMPVVLAAALLSGFDNSVTSTWSASRFFCFLPFFSLGYYVDEQKMLQRVRSREGRMVCIPLAVAACVFLFMIHQSFPAENFFGSTAYAVIYPEQPFYGLASRMLFFVTAALASLGIMAVMPKKRGLLSFIGENTLQIYLVHGMVLEVVWEQLLAHGALSSNAKLDTIYKELILLAAIAAACAVVIAVKYMIRRIRVRCAERKLRAE
ncbi:MAG: acyltransferase family protein [Oscillospiraceae bacterium]|nr:acyltransferase family protein [Oscillospiraceae bacterium]MDY3065424.1 acyltransferase family protein [Oscillospiraceae bacterium]